MHPRARTPLLGLRALGRRRRRPDGPVSATVEIDTFQALRATAVGAVIAVAAVTAMVLFMLQLDPFDSWPERPTMAPPDSAPLAAAPPPRVALGPARPGGSPTAEDRRRRAGGDRRVRRGDRPSDPARTPAERLTNGDRPPAAADRGSTPAPAPPQPPAAVRPPAGPPATADDDDPLGPLIGRRPELPALAGPALADDGQLPDAGL